MRARSFFSPSTRVRTVLCTLSAAACALLPALASAGDRSVGAPRGVQRLDSGTRVIRVQTPSQPTVRDDAQGGSYGPPPYLIRSRDARDEALEPEAPAEARPAGRLSAEERKQLRKNIQDAGRDIYRR